MDGRDIYNFLQHALFSIVQKFLLTTGGTTVSFQHVQSRTYENCKQAKMNQQFSLAAKNKHHLIV